MAFVLHSSIVIPCPLERVVAYFNVYAKPEVIVYSYKILGVPGPKTFWMPWRMTEKGMTEKRISRKTSLAKYEFRKSEEVMSPLSPPFVGEPD